jgi:hypothetical protein
VRKDSAGAGAPVAGTVCHAAFLILGVAFAQSDYGSLSGFAKDPSGAVVPKAKVTIRNEATHQEWSAVTRVAGLEHRASEAVRHQRANRLSVPRRAYDFINHADLSGPQLNPTSSQFGMITSKTGLARNLQLTLRFYF